MIMFASYSQNILRYKKSSLCYLSTTSSVHQQEPQCQIVTRSTTAKVIVDLMTLLFIAYRRIIVLKFIVSDHISTTTRAAAAV